MSKTAAEFLEGIQNSLYPDDLASGKSTASEFLEGIQLSLHPEEMYKPEERRPWYKELPSSFGRHGLGALKGVAGAIKMMRLRDPGAEWIAARQPPTTAFRPTAPPESELVDFSFLDPERYEATKSKGEYHWSKDPMWWFGGLAGLLPYTAGAAGSWALAGPAGAFAFTAAAEGGNAYEDALEAGAPEWKAELAGLSVGLVNGTLETLSFGIISAPVRKAIGKPGVRALTRYMAAEIARKGVRGVATRAGKHALTGIMTEGITEVFQEGWQMWMANVFGNADYTWEQGVEAMIQAGLMGGFGGGVFGAGGQMMAEVLTKPVAGPQVPEAIEVKARPTEEEAQAAQQEILAEAGVPTAEQQRQAIAEIEEFAAQTIEAVPEEATPETLAQDRGLYAPVPEVPAAESVVPPPAAPAAAEGQKPAAWTPDMPVYHGTRAQSQFDEFATPFVHLTTNFGRAAHYAKGETPGRVLQVMLNVKNPKQATGAPHEVKTREWQELTADGSDALVFRDGEHWDVVVPREAVTSMSERSEPAPATHPLAAAPAHAAAAAETPTQAVIRDTAGLDALGRRRGSYYRFEQRGYDATAVRRRLKGLQRATDAAFREGVKTTRVVEQAKRADALMRAGDKYKARVANLRARYKVARDAMKGKQREQVALRDRVKHELAVAARELLPPDARGKIIAALDRVKTEQGLEKAMVQLEGIAEDARQNAAYKKAVPVFRRFEKAYPTMHPDVKALAQPLIEQAAARKPSEQRRLDREGIIDLQAIAEDVKKQQEGEYVHQENLLTDEFIKHLADAADQAKRVPLRDMDADTILAVTQAAQYFLASDKSAKGSIEQAQAAEADAHVDAMIEQLGRPEAVERVKESRGKLAAIFSPATQMPIEELCHMMDGGKRGPFWRAFFHACEQVLSNQYRTEETLWHDLHTALTDAGVSPQTIQDMSYIFREKPAAVAISLPSGGHVNYTAAELISFWLHSQREANRAALRSKHGHTLNIPPAKTLWNRFWGITKPIRNRFTQQFSDADIAAINAHVTPEMRTLGTVGLAFLNSQGKDIINAVSVEGLGFELAQVEDRMPMRRDPEVVRKDVKEPTPRMDFMRRILDSLPFLKKRTGGDAPLIIEDFFEMMAREIRQTAAYTGANRMRMVRRIINNPALANAVKKKVSLKDWDSLVFNIKHFEDASAATAVLDSKANTMLSRALRSIFSTFPSIAVKQTTSSWLYGPVLGDRSLLLGMQSWTGNDAPWLTELARRYAPIIHRRLRFGGFQRELGEVVQATEAYQRWLGRSPLTIQMAKPVRAGDALAVGIGGRAALSLAAEQAGLEIDMANPLNLPEDVLAEAGRLWQDATRTTQPSWESLFRGRMSAERTFLSRAFTTFGGFHEKGGQFLRMGYREFMADKSPQAFGRYVNKHMRLYMVYALGDAISLTLGLLKAGDDEKRAKRVWKKFWVNMAAGIVTLPVRGIHVARQVIQTLTNWPVYGPQDSIVPGNVLSQLFQTITRAGLAFTNIVSRWFGADAPDPYGLTQTQYIRKLQQHRERQERDAAKLLKYGVQAISRTVGVPFEAGTEYYEIGKGAVEILTPDK